MQHQPPKDPRASAFLGCVQIADADGFVPLRRGLRTQAANFGDFIRASTAARKSRSARANRFASYIGSSLLILAWLIFARLIWTYLVTSGLILF